MSEAVDLLIRGDVVITMDRARTQLSDGAVAVRRDRIVAVLPAADAAERFHAAATLGGPGTIVLPGFVNAHQHLTGSRLLRSTIPDDVTPDVARRHWVLPAHVAHTADDDELSATLSLIEGVENGITFTVEAGTVSHPARVLAAFDRVGVGGTLGTWGWDHGTGPHVAPLADVIARQSDVLDLTRHHPRVRGWITLVGHDSMSDPLLVAAGELARRVGAGLTFHLSSTPEDIESYGRRTARRPLVHLAGLGVLGPHVLVAHALHVNDAELDVLLAHRVGVASCPWAYLRLAKGATQAFRHAELIARGGRVALGCDNENAGDAVDVLLAARLFAGLAKDTRRDSTRFTARAALALATIDGARALGLDDEIGSLEPGKRADVVLVDTTGAAWIPHAADPVTALVWASDGRAVRDVVASGRVVVRDGRCVSVSAEERAELAAQARTAHVRLVARCGATPPHE